MTTNTPKNSDKFATLETALRHFGDLGAIAGKGANSNLDFLIGVATATERGLMDATTKVKNKAGDEQLHAAIAWSRFRQSKCKVEGEVAGIKSADKIRTSEINTVIKAALKHKGADPDEVFSAQLNRARELVKPIEIKNSPMWDRLVKVARTAEKSDTPLTDDEIVAAVRPAEESDPEQRAAKDEAQQLVSIIKALDTLQNGTKGTADVAGKQAYPNEAYERAKGILSERLSVVSKEDADKLQAAFAKKNGAVAAHVTVSTLIPATRK